MTKSFYIGLLALVCFCLMPFRAMASDEAGENPYGIRQEAYLQYKNAYDNYTDRKLLAVSDSLMMQYQAHRDANYLLLAYVLQHLYFSYEDDEVSFDNAVQKGKQLALELNHQDDYYLFCANEINFNMYVTRRQFVALQQARELMAKAEESGNPVAMFLSAYSLATVYHLRQNWPKAYECFERSADYILHFGLKERQSSLSLIYMMMGIAQLNMNNYDKALACAEKSLNSASIGNVDAKFIQLSVYFLENREEEFFALLEEVRSYVENDEAVDPEFSIYVETYDAIMRHDYTRAMQLAKRFSNPYNQMEAAEMVYLRQNDYQHAYEVSKRMRIYNDSVNASLDGADIDEINARLHTSELEMQAWELKTQNAQTVYAGILLLMALSLAYFMIHSINRRKSLRKLAASHKALLNAQESERKAKASTEMALRRTEEALAKAEQADKMKREFISNVSHEIRTPMNAISGFAQLLLDPEVELPMEEKQVCSQQIQENTDRLTRLINNILEISNLDTGLATVDRRLVNCNVVLEECQSYYVELKKINLELVPGKTVYVHSDIERIKSILTRLIENCIRFAYDEPVTMGISLSEYAGKIAIYIADRGPGIPAEMEYSIFDRFKKVDEFSPGMGLGLSIAKAQAESLGGQLILDVHYEGGCRFVLILPKD